MNRNDVLSRAVNECMKELYSLAQPKVEWDDFVKQNEEWKEGDPKPYEFYYLPKDIFKEIVEDYIYAYKIGHDIRDDFDVLSNYFKSPVIEVYSKEQGRHYKDLTPLKEIIGEESFNKVEEYINNAKEFYRVNYELNSFNWAVYLGASPNSNKEAVIKNWKKYKNQDIVIDESIYEDDEIY